MALNIDTQDLENYPGNTKRVTLDIDSVVPIGYGGDEQIIISISTTAYSDIANRTAIQDLYVINARSGWVKSSGFLGNKFALDNTHNEIRIKLDNTVSGTSQYDSSWGYYAVALVHDDGAYINGEAIAEDMQTKIRAIPTSENWNVSDAGYILSYKNCVVDFKDGKFKIISGSMGNYYTGANKSSAAVVSGTQNDCSELLGFDLYMSSEDLDNISVREAAVTTNYTANDTTLWIQTGTGVSIGGAMMITDNTNTDYFMVEDVAGDAQLTVVSGSITNDYTADRAKVQLLRMQDPDAGPESHYESVDSLGRYGIMSMINQIDYSS